MITIQDFGQLNPLFDNSTWEGRRKKPQGRCDCMATDPVMGGDNDFNPIQILLNFVRKIDV
jgi:hypothetical protein